MDRIEAAARELRAADTAIALTGAGVSVPSGIPPFRGEGGIWNEYDPDTFDVHRFRRDPGAFWADWLELRADLFDASVEPNAAHDALAALSARGHLDAVVTQNIDGLHGDAGSDEVLELHGNARRAVCQRCGRAVPAADVRERVRAGERPPRCETEDCDGVLKPDAVLFGERLPPEALARAERFAADSEVFLVAGSSLTVEPAASLPARAASGATLILVNLDETPLDARADYVFREDVTDALPALRDAVVG
ncbi:SIR2 family NAD-dependent protein deacylase [Halorussus aquaticus]|uniref:NAD-dependent protein deacylase n=1 Tax=Halorussus aquaticus TaxID=2953748 RepID=A0ABD5Q2G1_9EURY|nr:Sir2 family NAD-dependent protein deacetylase [Halorussus aquaticus]